MIMFGRGAHGVGNPEITDSERRHAGHVMFGRVAEVDYAKAKVRVAIGDEDDEDGHLVTGWLPIGAARAGGDIEWDPPEVDERVMVLSESGEVQNGVVMKAGYYSDQAPAPGNKAGLYKRTFKDGASITYDRDSGEYTVEGKSKVTHKVGDATVVNDGSTIKLSIGDATLTVQNGTITLAAGGQTFVVGGSGAESSGKIKGNNGLEVTGSPFTHEGHDVGKDHKHQQVQPGGGLSGTPQ